MDLIKIIRYCIILLMISANSFAQINDWQYYYEKANLQLKGEMYQFALENLIKALDRNPSLYDAANKISYIYTKWNRNREALDYLSISLKINDKQANAHNIAGELNDFFGNYEEALLHYKKAVEIDPSFIPAHINLVRYYFKRNERAEANSHFEICYNLGKSEGEKYFNLALAEENKRNYKEAIAFYKQALDKNPAYMNAYFNIVEIYRRMNQNDEAIKYLEKIKEIQPDIEKVYLYLGHLYYAKRFTKKRKYILDLAIKNLKKAIELDPSDYETCYFISEIYRFMKDDIHAAEFLNKASEMQKKSAK